MALMSIPSNLFLVFPAYGTVCGYSTETIVGLYQKILPSVGSLIQCLLIFNVPFTFVKGLCAAVVSMVLYKKLRPVFNGLYRE